MVVYVLLRTKIYYGVLWVLKYLASFIWAPIVYIARTIVSIDEGRSLFSFGIYDATIGMMWSILRSPMHLLSVLQYAYQFLWMIVGFIYAFVGNVIYFIIHPIELLYFVLYGLHALIFDILQFFFFDLPHFSLSVYRFVLSVFH